MSPFLFALAVGRLVPILLATTAVLVTARLCADKVGSSARMNRVLFGAILAAGLVAQVPHALRSTFGDVEGAAASFRGAEGAATGGPP